MLSLLCICMVLMKCSDFYWPVQDQGISILTQAIAACTEAIEAQKGKLVVKEPARAVSVNFFICSRVFICFEHLMKLELFSEFLVSAHKGFFLENVFTSFITCFPFWASLTWYVVV